MEQTDILEKILDNTEQVKTVIVKKVAKKEKSAKAKAEAKFKRVGTKLNEAEYSKFEATLQELGLNQSQYIKKLLEQGLTSQEETKTFWQQLKTLFTVRT